MRDLEASAIEAAILIDRGNPAGAIEATKSHLSRVPQVKDKRVLTLFSTAYATAMRITGKAPVGLEFLRKAIGRAKELGLSPNEESPLRAAMALTYVQSRQNEAAHAALEVVAKFADEPALSPLARAALLQPRDPAPVCRAGPRRPRRRSSARPRPPSAARPSIASRRRAPTSRSPRCSSTRASPRRRSSTSARRRRVAEDLGHPPRRRPPPDDDGRDDGQRRARPRARSAVALGSYQTGPDWAGFEPVFLVTERRLQEVLAKGAPDEKAPADMVGAPRASPTARC